MERGSQLEAITDEDALGRSRRCFFPSFRSQETGQGLSISTSRGGPSHNSQFKTLYVQKYSGTLKRKKLEELRRSFRFQIPKIDFH